MFYNCKLKQDTCIIKFITNSCFKNDIIWEGCFECIISGLMNDKQR